MNDVPRWQQGPRPGAYGNAWDALTPRERRRAFVGDVAVAFTGAGLIWLIGYWLAS